jgi:hypothetical protein
VCVCVCVQIVLLYFVGKKREKMHSLDDNSFSGRGANANEMEGGENEQSNSLSLTPAFRTW